MNDTEIEEQIDNLIEQSTTQSLNNHLINIIFETIVCYKN